jgi:spore germination protein GerM
MKEKKTAMDARKWALLALSAVVLVVLAVIFFRSGGQELIKPRGEAGPAAAPRESEQPAKSKVVTLFFGSEDDSLLHAEERKIAPNPSVVQEATEVVQELIKGPEKGLLAALPPETKLRQLFVTKEGVAYVDFSKELIDKHPSGSSAELSTVYSVVNTLAYNFKSIKKVFILVEGAEKETLGGHINLSEAFVPVFSLNAQ